MGKEGPGNVEEYQKASCQKQQMRELWEVRKTTVNHTSNLDFKKTSFT